MPDLVRFSVSLEANLLEEFDRYCAEQHCATRSEAIRQLLREKLTTHAWEDGAADVAASLTLVYDHHRSHLTDKMLELQHTHARYVVATMHVHLSHDLCMETVALRGPAQTLRRVASELSGLKGIHQAQLVVACAPPHHH
jgi:CopG family nickel-responsive transcriptional regulator